MGSHRSGRMLLLGMALAVGLAGMMGGCAGVASGGWGGTSTSASTGPPATQPVHRACTQWGFQGVLVSNVGFTPSTVAADCPAGQPVDICTAPDPTGFCELRMRWEAGDQPLGGPVAFLFDLPKGGSATMAICPAYIFGSGAALDVCAPQAVRAGERKRLIMQGTVTMDGGTSKAMVATVRAPPGTVLGRLRGFMAWNQVK